MDTNWRRCCQTSPVLRDYPTRARNWGSLRISDLHQRRTEALYSKTLRVAVMSITRSDHALAAFHRRLAGRIGKAKAITATARKLAIIIYCMLRDGTPYRDQPAAEYDERHRKRALLSLRKRAQSLGFDLVQIDTGLVLQ